MESFVNLGRPSDMNEDRVYLKENHDSNNVYQQIGI